MTNEEIKKEATDDAQKIEDENKRLEEALNKRQELLKKQDELSARNRLGGESEAGTPQLTDKELKEKADDEMAKRIKQAVGR